MPSLPCPLKFYLSIHPSQLAGSSTGLSVCLHRTCELSPLNHKIQVKGETIIRGPKTAILSTCEAVNPFTGDEAIPSNIEPTL